MKIKDVLFGLTTAALLLAMQPVAGTSEVNAQEMGRAKQMAEFANSVNRYTVTWETPSANASGSMPIGNGEVGANVWMEADGSLLFYLSRTDSWAENGDLYKLGRVRVTFYPFLKGDNVKFSQKLNLAEGKIEFKIRDGRDSILLQFLTDIDAPIAYLQGESSYPLHVAISSEIWRTQTRMLPVAERHHGIGQSPYDSLALEYADIVKDADDRIIVFHRNAHSLYYPATIRLEDMATPEVIAADPYLNRTFGYEIVATGSTADDGAARSAGYGHDERFVKMGPTILETAKPVRSFCVKAAAVTRQTQTAEEWEAEAGQALRDAPCFALAERRTSEWWTEHWNRSYLEIETPDNATGEKLTQAYLLQDWMTACGGRGNYPIKFNGSIYTVDPGFTDTRLPYSPDYRRWGPDYWWQNTRLMYHPMLKSGEFEVMQVLFRHYFALLPMLKRNAEVLYGAQGAIIPETSTIFGTFNGDDYGWNRSGMKTGEVDCKYIRDIWNPGLELAAMMADYYRYTNDSRFARDTLVPFANEILRYFETRFPRNEKGVMFIAPSHAIETYWTDVVNDLPNVSGLHYVVGSLLALPVECSSAEDRTHWKQLERLIPPIPQQVIDGKKVFVPAERKDEKRTNQENPELYVVFPFSLCNVSSSDRQEGIDTYNCRLERYTFGWTQDGQEAAILGLTEEARKNVLAKISNSNPSHRFPAYWGPNFDWAPDQTHGGNLMTTLQDMVLQSYEKGDYVLPAFPKEWNVRFKLFSFGRNLVTGWYRDGKWVEKPKSQRNDGRKIYICNHQ
jgi:hypothetical protein